MYTFQVIGNHDDYDNVTILVPCEYSHMPISTLLAHNDDDDYDDDVAIPVYKPGDDIFWSLVHTALKLQSDVLAQQVYKGVKVSKEAFY